MLSDEEIPQWRRLITRLQNHAEYLGVHTVRWLHCQLSLPAAISKLGQFFLPHSACVLVEKLVPSTWCLIFTLQGEVKYPTQEINVCLNSLILI